MLKSNEILEIYRKEENKYKRLALANNFKVVLYKEVISQFLEIWNKYEGKQYGEKTKEKIWNEIKENLHISGYFGYDYFSNKKDTLTLYLINDEGYKYPDNNLNLNIHCLYNEDLTDFYAFVNKNNTIQKVSIDMIKLGSTIEYIEDVNEFVNQAKNQYETIRTELEKLDNIRQEYNKQYGYILNQSIDSFKYLYKWID